MDRSLKSVVLVFVLLPALIGLTACDNYDSIKTAHLDKAQALLDEGKLKRAALEYRKVLQIDPKHSDAWYQLAQIAEAEEDWRKAYHAYNRAVELAPDNSAARVRLGAVQLAANAPDEALSQAEAVFAAQPQHPAALALRGFVRLRQDNPAAALADAEQALQQQPDHVEALALLAQVRVTEDDLPAARQVLQRALSAHPEEKRFILALAGVSERLGDTAAARDSLERLIALEPQAPTRRTRLAGYLLARNDTAAAEQVLREAVDALPHNTQAKLALSDFFTALDRTDEAIKTLAGFVAQTPDDDLRFALARLHQSAGDTAKAEDLYRGIVERAGEDPAGLRAQSQLAALALAQGKLDEAQQWSHAVLTENNQDSDALTVRAALALQDVDAAQAITDLRTVLRDRPESVGYLRLARLRERNGDLEGASVVLNDLLGRRPDSPIAQAALARIRRSQPDNEALVKTAEQFLRTRPEHPLGHYLSGLVAQHRGDPTASLPRFETALDKQPKAAEPLIALTRSLFALRRYEYAQQRLEQARTDGADAVVTTRLLGELYLATDEPQKAAAVYRQAIELRPGAPLAYERLARQQFDAGDRAAAIKTLRNGIAASNNSPLLSSALPIVLEQAGRHDEAIAAYEDALQVNPNSVATANNLAMLLANHRADDPDQLARALELAKPFKGSGQAALLDTLGCVYYRRGDTARAVHLLERAVTLGDTTPERQYHLGMAYMKAGRPKDAKPLLTAAAEAKLPFMGQNEACAAIDSL